MRCGGSTGGLRACNDQQSSGGGSVQEGGEGGGAESAEYSWHSKCSAVRLERCHCVDVPVSGLRLERWGRRPTSHHRVHVHVSIARRRALVYACMELCLDGRG